MPRKSYRTEQKIRPQTQPVPGVSKKHQETKTEEFLFVKKLIRILACLLTVCMLTAAVSVTSVAQASSENEQTIHEFLTEDMSLSDAAACGVLANMKAESGLRANIYNSNHSSYGLCQWSGSRLNNLKNYCNRNGYDWHSMNGQLHYLQYELTNSYKSVYNSLKGIGNIRNGAYNAGYKFCYNYEVPANRTSRSQQRGNIAKNTFWPHYA